MPRVYGNSPGKPSVPSGGPPRAESAVYRRSSGRPERVVKRALRSPRASDLDLVSAMRNRYSSDLSLQLASAAERGHGEKNEQQRDRNGYANQPVRHIAGPRTERGIQPPESQDRKRRANDFIEKLSEDPPKPPESTRFDRAARQAWRRRHTAILAERPCNLARGTPYLGTGKGCGWIRQRRERSLVSNNNRA